MADNVAITPGSGASVAADNVGGTLYQRVKLAHGADGSATDVSAASGLPVNIVSGTVALSGEEHFGETGISQAVIRPTIAVTAGAYSAGDVVGGRITLTNAMRTSGGTGKLTDLLITTADGELFECTVLLFDAATASAIADNAAFAWGAGDHAKLLARIPVVAADYATLGADGVAHLRNLGVGVAAVGSANLIAYVVATATPTFAATTDLAVAFKFDRN
jgi:hypothetical protein